MKRICVLLAILALALSLGLSMMAASDDAYIIQFPYDEWEDPTDGDPAALPIIMTFGEDGNAKVLDETNSYFGNAAVSDGVVRITYSEETNLFVNYMAKLKFNSVEKNNSARFVRVLYCAQNPSGVENASIMMEDDSAGKRVLIQEKVADTAGHYVLSDIAVLSPAITSRFMDCAHSSIYFTTSKPGGEYIIKAIYFFETREGAENYEYNLDPNETADITTVKPEDVPTTDTTATPDVDTGSVTTEAGTDVITSDNTTDATTPAAKDNKGTVIAVVCALVAVVIVVVVVTVVVKKRK